MHERLAMKNNSIPSIEYRVSINYRTVTKSPFVFKQRKTEGNIITIIVDSFDYWLKTGGPW